MRSSGTFSLNSLENSFRHQENCKGLVSKINTAKTKNNTSYSYLDRMKTEQKTPKYCLIGKFSTLWALKQGFVIIA